MRALVISLALAFTGCAAETETSLDAGTETQLYGEWSVLFETAPCLPGERLVEFEIRRYAGVPMLMVTMPERDLMTAGMLLDETDGRVRWEDVTGALYDMTLSLDGETASAFVHYEYEHCAADVDAVSVKKGRL